MLKWFIIHQWREAVRSPIWHRKLASNIFIGILMFYIGLNLLGVGLFLDKILAKTMPDKNPVTALNGFLFLYFGADLMMRVMLQKMPGLSIQPYLHLRIKRTSMVHYLLSKTVWSLFNFLPLLVFVPFTIKAVIPTYSLPAAFLWLTVILILLHCNSYLTIFLKRQALVNPKTSGALMLGILGLFASEYFGVFSFTVYSSAYFGGLLQNPTYLFAPLLVLVILYALNYRFLRHNIYLDELSDKKGSTPVSAGSFGFLENYGEVGALVSLEMKLILRHKRLKSTLYMTPLILIIGLMFFASERYQRYDILLVYMGIFFTGMFMINYGQFILSWESHYFDAIIANKIDPFRYFQAKYVILVTSCTAMYLIMLPFAYFGVAILYMITAVFLFNIGVNSFLLLFKSTFNRQKIDLNVSAMSMQGKDSKQFLIVILLVIVPIFIYLPFKAAEAQNMGYLAIGAVGILGLLFHKPLLNMVVGQFIRQKYKIGAGFREA